MTMRAPALTLTFVVALLGCTERAKREGAPAPAASNPQEPVVVAPSNVVPVSVLIDHPYVKATQKVAPQPSASGPTPTDTGATAPSASASSKK